MVQRVFLDWAQPLLSGLTEWLAASGWREDQGILDLSDAAVVVPTAGAGRRLRQALAQWAAERRAGVLSPLVITPEVLIAWGADSPAEASAEMAGRGEQVMAWAAVLAGLDLNQWRSLFPVDPVNQDLPWAMSAAGDLLKLRRTLEEGGRDLRMAAETLGPDNPESARWQTLARLEALAVKRLERGGWRDPVTARLEAAASPVLPEAVRQVILAGAPDSIRLTRMALEAMDAQGLARVTVVIHAPASLAETFDLWGRPLAEVWMTREINLPDGHGAIRLTSRPEDAAALLMERLEATRTDPGSLAIGSADQEVSGPLRRLAAEADIPVFDPEGLPLLAHEISWLVKTLTRLLHTGAWQAAGQLLRIPDVLSLAVSAVGGTDARRLLEEWDAFQLDRLPQSLAQAAGPAENWSEQRWKAAGERALATTGKPLPAAPGRVLSRVLEWFRHLLEDFKNPSLPEALTRLLERVYSGRKFSTGADRQRFVAAVTAWQEAAVSVEKGASAFLPRLSTAGRLDLAAVLVKDARLYTAHPDEARALHGWLELPWQEAPELIIAGLNEGMVPDSVLGDAWLPDSVRASLDLKTNDTRLARDSYLLTAMTASRRRSGALRLLCGRMNAAGDPLKPSRLLLRCPPAELPERALRLFPKELDDQRGRTPAPPWQRAWKLKVPPMPEDSPVLKRLNVTAFADYLKCPLRFYLRHVLKMEAFDATRAELESRAVGSLFHSAMEEFHKQPDLRDSQDEGRITGFLHDRLEERVSREYGDSLTVPVDMQLEVVRNCLARAALIHAQESSLGWRFHGVELTFPGQVTLKGTEIRGRIDLVQHHPELGYRILDYKTSTKAVKPVEAHLKSVSSKSEKDRLRRLPGREWAVVDDGARLYRWKNLQLPLYARIMAAHYGVERVQVGYISLPRAVSEARLEVWDGLDSALQTAAWACAGGVIDSVRQGLFWPPGRGLEYDDFESLVFEDTESSFDPALLHGAHSRLSALAASADHS